MQTHQLVVALGLVATCAFGAVPIPGDSRQGAEVFQGQKCVVCHSINGQGGSSAPDLGKRTARSYTPSLMASLMWNHAPQMWSAMTSQAIPRPQISADQAADLFAYLYSVRFFERPGDAARGKQVFTSKRCAGCHGVTEALPGGPKPAVAWNTVNDAILLAQEMWNHSSMMKEALSKKNAAWPQLSSQELTDLLVYVQHLPQWQHQAAEFTPASAETGKTLFDLKGCAGCHTGKTSLENRFTNRTLTDFAVAMWNHAPQMKQPPPPLRAEEMRRIVGYLWSRQIFDQPGSAARGKAVFASKKCASCHEGGAAPSLSGRTEPLNSLSMVAALWRHGPVMQEKMKSMNVAWPHFAGAEMADLLAYLSPKP